MVAHARTLPSLLAHPEPVEARLFTDERRIHDELARFLAFAGRNGNEPMLAAQLRPILNVSGKRIRPLLPFWLLRAAGASGEPASPDAVTRVAVATLALHSAAIVIDDIEDGSVERQSQAALHLRHGLGPTLNAASLLIFAALEYLGDPALMALAVDTISRCHVGQALDLAFADAEVAATLFDGGAELRAQRWVACTRMKTSQLMEWSVRAAAHALGLPAGIADALAGAIVEYGIGYQMLDDVKNLRPDLVGAKAYEDLPCGLRSWVCLELLAELLPDELAWAKSIYGTPGFALFVRLHRRLPDAIERATRAGQAHLRHATRRLAELTDGREADYLGRLLGRPLEDLEEGA